MKNIKKLSSFIVLLVVVFLAICFFFSNSVLADGMIIMKPDPDLYPDRWDYLDENDQQVFINHDNGLQKMIISVSFNKENSSDVVWLFPVPSDPNKVVIDVVKNLPQLSGEEISKKAKSNLNDILEFLQMTQVYTIPFTALSKSNNYGDIGSSLDALSETIGPPDMEQDVVVYEHLEKEGVTSEIITAKTATGLYDYLEGRGLKIESGSIPVLDNYIGKDYSFIVSWISSPEQVKSTQSRGVFVTFPTKDIYYPMLPTSVYGSKIVPATIRIIGHVSPKVFQDIKSYTKTEYYIGVIIGVTEDLKNFYSGQNQNLKYTKIEINAPSKFLTDDLWISKIAPIKTYFSMFITTYPEISAIFLLIIISLLIGVLVGWIVFKELRKNIFKLALMGLSNCLSILGLLITTMFISTKEKNQNIELLLTEIQQKGYFWKRKWAIIILLFGAPFSMLSVLLTFSVFSNLLDWFSRGRFYATDELLDELFIFLVGILPLVLALIIGRVRSKDKNLFEQLKLNNYSSWSFQPKDKAKIIFVPLFSISFLIISWALVKLLGFIV